MIIFPKVKFGVYIHWPFCQHRCHYCDFLAFEKGHSEDKKNAYVQALKKHLEKLVTVLPSGDWSLYLGGGTPSLLSPQRWEEILQPILKSRESDLIEVTVEFNPETLCYNDQFWLDLGVTRVSLGVQSFQNKFLEKLGRKHDQKAVFSALDRVSAWGIPISVDLMFGLPHQKIEDWEKDLSQIKNWPIHHVSCYNLSLPEGHPLNQHRPGPELEEMMFQMARHMLNSMGFHQYEISNFAKPGFECQHNLLYWSHGEYWGVGLGAWGFWPGQGKWGVRHQCPPHWDEYQKCVAEWMPSVDELSKGWLPNFLESLELTQALTDFFLMNFRLTQGWPWDNWLRHFGHIRGLAQWMWNYLIRLENQGWIEKFVVSDRWFWKINPERLFISNELLRRLTFSPEDLPLVDLD